MERIGVKRVRPELTRLMGQSGRVLITVHGTDVKGLVSAVEAKALERLEAAGQLDALLGQYEEY